MFVIETLADWVARSPVVQRPLAIARAVEAIRDTVACMVAGAADPATLPVHRTIAAYGAGPSSVIGCAGASHGRAPAPWAALANGVAAHALDFDDNFIPGATHASAVLVPALLALAEERGASGASVVDAYLTGLEVHAVLGRGVGRAHYDLGWHNTSTVGCIGTAAACARLLGLDREASANAMSLGVSMSSGVKVQFGAHAKPFHAGMAAKNAVLAATLAANGLAGRADAIEGSRGFLELYAGDARRDWSALLERIGEPHSIEEFGLLPKRHPCCGSAHRVIDGVLSLRARHGFDASEVARVDTVVAHGNARNLCYDDPQQEMEARFSMHYCVALALAHGRLTLADFTPEAVHRAELRRLMPLVTMRSSPQTGDERIPHEVTITMRDATVVHTSVQWARGAIQDPFDQHDIDAKFRDCCARWLTPADLAAADAALGRIADLAAIEELMRHLNFDAQAKVQSHTVHDG